MVVPGELMGGSEGGEGSEEGNGTSTVRNYREVTSEVLIEAKKRIGFRSPGKVRVTGDIVR